jgi:hypothetical protein
VLLHAKERLPLSPAVRQRAAAAATAPAVLAYFQHDFTVISTDRFGDTLQGRVSPGTGRDGHARRH